MALRPSNGTVAVGPSLGGQGMQGVGCQFGPVSHLMDGGKGEAVLSVTFEELKSLVGIIEQWIAAEELSPTMTAQVGLSSFPTRSSKDLRGRCACGQWTMPDHSAARFRSSSAKVVTYQYRAPEGPSGTQTGMEAFQADQWPTSRPVTYEASLASQEWGLFCVANALLSWSPTGSSLDNGTRRFGALCIRQTKQSTDSVTQRAANRSACPTRPYASHGTYNSRQASFPQRQTTTHWSSPPDALFATGWRPSTGVTPSGSRVPSARWSWWLPNFLDSDLEVDVLIDAGHRRSGPSRRLQGDIRVSPKRPGRSRSVLVSARSHRRRRRASRPRHVAQTHRGSRREGEDRVGEVSRRARICVQRLLSLTLLYKRSAARRPPGTQVVPI